MAVWHRTERNTTASYAYTRTNKTEDADGAGREQDAEREREGEQIRTEVIQNERKTVSIITRPQGLFVPLHAVGRSRRQGKREKGECKMRGCGISRKPAECAPGGRDIKFRSSMDHLTKFPFGEIRVSLVIYYRHANVTFLISWLGKRPSRGNCQSRRALVHRNILSIRITR